MKTLPEGAQCFAGSIFIAPLAQVNLDDLFPIHCAFVGYRDG